MGAMASRLFAQPFVSGADQRKHQSSMSLAFVRGNPLMTGGFPSQKASNAEMFPFDDVTMDGSGWSVSKETGVKKNGQPLVV